MGTAVAISSAACLETLTPLPVRRGCALSCACTGIGFRPVLVANLRWDGGVGGSSQGYGARPVLFPLQNVSFHVLSRRSR